MSEPPHPVDVAAWVARAAQDPVAHRQRQAVEIILNAIAMTGPLNTELFLKGGILLGLAYGSPRQTTDIDLTAGSTADGDIDDRIGTLLNSAFPRTAASLGYADLVLRTQSAKGRPNHIFPEAEFPALKLTIAYARRGTNEERALNEGTASTVINVDISFNEPLNHVQVLELTGGQELYAYGVIDLVAEKYRALLQQIPRNRYRRQDVYDLDILLPGIHSEEISPANILDALLEKCSARHIEPNHRSLDNAEIKNRASRDWNTMDLELDDLPEFEVCYERVATFYRSLPWDGA
ncbi:MAG: nucleotidyl transferase AbiEii/AbiGii toxin family protein [Rhodospirillaceae bacterium]|nr:nucleotidyl transferase AbiEii/AbiGii toxin family protein [Rhodospirillaceae bacterium]